MSDGSLSILQNELFPFIKQNWYSKRALFALIALELLFLLPYLWIYFGEGLSFGEYIVIFLVVGVSSLIWALSRKYPKNIRNKIGLLVAVTTESRKEYLRLRSDLILGMKDVVRTKKKENIFHIIELPEYYASKIQDHPSSKKALEKAEAHFIVYGTCKQRLEKGVKHYFMTLGATVIHKPIPKIISDRFAREFGQLFPRRVLFPIEDEISGFEITKEWIGLVARYMIGIAALLSQDFDLSLELFRELHAELKHIDSDIGAIKTMKTRIPKRIAESALASADRRYFIYRRSKDKRLLCDIKPLLDILKAIDPNNYSAHLLRGIYLFLVERNIQQAKEEIKKSKNALDATWRYSEAFLYAYEGNLGKAEKSYKKAFKCDVKPDVLFQTEEFLNDVLETEPSHCQLWYCLGMINLFAKQDKILAKQAFEEFLTCGSDTDHSEQKRKVKEYLKQLGSKT